MITYYDITEYFKNTLESIEDVRTIINTDTIDNKFEVENYDTALAVCTFEPQTSEDSHVVFNVRIEVVDLIDTSNEITSDKFTGNNNIVDVYNSTLAIVRRLHLQLTHKPNDSNKIQIDPSPTIEKLRDLKDNVAGYAIEMTIRVDDGITSLC